MPNFFKIEFIKAFLKRLVSNRDTQTTVLGVVASAILASKLDYGKLLNKDPNEIGSAIGVVVVAVFGYYTNKHTPLPLGGALAVTSPINVSGMTEKQIQEVVKEQDKAAREKK